VFAEEEARLLLDSFGPSVDPADGIDSPLRRRVAGEPLEHVLGVATFCGLPISVRPPVFIPRRRAEVLALAAVDDVRCRPDGATVLDLGCGSAAIAAVVAAADSTARVWASDVSTEAVQVARLNAVRYDVAVVRSDWWSDIPTELTRGVDVVVAYLPHVPDDRLDEVPADYRRAEQRLAISGGPDGMDPLRCVLTGLHRWLAPGGSFLTLLAAEQRDLAVTLIRNAGWEVSDRAAADSVLLRVGAGRRQP
jgi:release factor glutamine methyltransferase